MDKTQISNAELQVLVDKLAEETEIYMQMMNSGTHGPELEDQKLLTDYLMMEIIRKKNSAASTF
jgi:hypothetical protein